MSATTTRPTLTELLAAQGEAWEAAFRHGCDLISNSTGGASDEALQAAKDRDNAAQDRLLELISAATR